MPALTNDGFEIVGATFGSANAWTFSVVSTAYTYNTFLNGNTPSPTVQSENGFEGFDGGWDNNDFALYLSELSSTIKEFDVVPQEYEDFENEWLNDGYEYVLTNYTVQDLNGYIGAEEFDDFKLTYLYTLTGLTSTIQPINGVGYEYFDVTGYKTTLLGPDVTNHIFEDTFPSADTVEDFEEVDANPDPSLVNKNEYWAQADSDFES